MEQQLLEPFMLVLDALSLFSDVPWQCGHVAPLQWNFWFLVEQKVPSPESLQLLASILPVTVQFSKLTEATFFCDSKCYLESCVFSSPLE